MFFLLGGALFVPTADRFPVLRSSWGHRLISVMWSASLPTNRCYGTVTIC